MTTLARVRVALSGSTITGPGLMTFYFDPASSAYYTSLDAFVTSIKDVFAGGTTLTVPNSADLILAETGEITGSTSRGTTTTVTSAGNTMGAQAVGARLLWRTGGIVHGRRVRGTTFVVPVPGDSYNSNGTLKAAPVTTLQSAANALVAAGSGQMRIWSRPVSAADATATVPQRDGSAHAVTSGTVAPSTSWLRSRRL